MHLADYVFPTEYLPREVILVMVTYNDIKGFVGPESG